MLESHAHVEPPTGVLHEVGVGAEGLGKEAELSLGFFQRHARAPVALLLVEVGQTGHQTDGGS